MQSEAVSRVSTGFHFYDEGALIERLSRGLKKRPQEVVFLVGAPLSSPVIHSDPGVPGVDGIIDLIRAEFADDAAQLANLNSTIAQAGQRRYQEAFLFLQGRRGQHAANEIVRAAVRAARAPGSGCLSTSFDQDSDEACRLMDSDIAVRVLTDGSSALGSLVAAYPQRFGRTILTTNFDPLIEVAIRRAGGQYLRTTLHSDGNLAQTEGSIGCHVIHLHGYWYGSDTLHTPRQLGQQRPKLKASLSALLRTKLVVVSAYGGWDDAFTEAMMDIIRDDAAYPEILWTFHSARPELSSRFREQIGPGVDRGRLTLYDGIDCHRVFPHLYELWTGLEPIASTRVATPSNPVRVSNELIEQVRAQVQVQTVLEGDDEDRPPVVEICVGRDAELKKVSESKANAVFVTGLGGQGKSTLAASYFADCQKERKFSLYVWRDCKEESERFENQLASVVERISGGKVRGKDLAKQNASAIIEILFSFISDLSVLFVFDNVDHYVNLETGKMTGSPDAFVVRLLTSGSNSQAVFTCRPSVTYHDPRSLSCRLEGLNLDAALRLFEQRAAIAERHEIEDAHHLTEGHAFWLDLLAIQLAKRAPAISLTELVREIRTGGGPLPSNTLNSVWVTLRDREQLVLRAMAETVKPGTEIEIGDYLSRKLGYNKVVQALKVLRALNLIVVKKRGEEPDVLELHPLVRQFIRRNFRADERMSFIEAIIVVYKRLIGTHRAQLGRNPSLSVLEIWTQNVELDISAGRFADAFLTLADVSDAFLSSAYPREFNRTARLLFSSVDWVTDYHKFPGFDDVFSCSVRLLSYGGEYDEVDSLLDRFEKTVPEKDARYISYCEARSFSNWIRGDFEKAIQWGNVGQQLKIATDVDTKHDVSHTLALAERDAGRPEAALPVFLAGQPLALATDLEELDETRGGVHYGNIGRCLHFMGQVEGALVCYQKSALLIEKNPPGEHALNQGYIRFWIGELLVAREQFILAEAFFRAAYLKWEHVFPTKALNVLQLSRKMKERIKNSSMISDSDVERVFLDWTVGRTQDSQFS